MMRKNVAGKFTQFLSGRLLVSLMTFALAPLVAQAAGVAPGPVRKPVAPQPPLAVAPRPPQFVLLAFDGSYSHQMWTDTRQFSKDMIAQSKPVHFTYFISSVYYINHNVRSFYTPEAHGAGASEIGWGETSGGKLQTRYDDTNLAHDEGQEIGSHACGHFDGSRWSLEGWRKEFAFFDKMISEFFSLNGVKPTTLFPNGWTFKLSDIVGFRAPQLGYNKDMFTALNERHFRYDTSQTAATNYWPQKNSGGQWNFPLGEVIIAGTGKHTLSMDYNFYYAQSQAKDDLAHQELYEQQMYDTYIGYFQSNYNGNRAPVNIGHHFSLWNGGAYWRAMQHVAKDVCGLPEVRCVTYSELANFMDTKSPAEIKSYSAGQFEHLTPVRLTTNKAYDVQMALHVKEDGSIQPQLAGRDAGLLKSKSNLHVRYLINGAAVSRDDFNLDTIRERAINGSTALIGSRVYEGDKEILSDTRRLVNVGQDGETLASESEEAHGLKGDLSEAHLDEVERAQ